MNDRADAINRIEALLHELGWLLGPEGDPDPDDDGPVGSLMLNQWVLVASWVDDNGDSYVTSGCASSMPEYQRAGLLRFAIDW